MTSVPERITGMEMLEALLSAPTAGVVTALRQTPGDIALLGAGGKMGPSLARMARRAADIADAGNTPRRIIAVSRFSEPGLEESLRALGIEAIAADLLDEASLNCLPDAPNVVFMTGMKFGASGNAAHTWAMNAWLPGLICARYRGSRVAAFSTGNVYGLRPVAGGGSVESDALQPQGEYAMSCLGRERIFEYFSRERGMPLSTIRLNYACEMRYGVLVDLAWKVWRGEPISLEMGYFNVIWQGDANAAALQALPHAASPPFVINVTGPEILRVRDVCAAFAAMMGKPAHFVGAEAPDALLNDARRATELFGPPQVSANILIRWVAEWVMQGGASLDRPTHFEVRDGRF